ncbi:MAG: Alpha/beta hydrolase [Promethearchaeota archaeon]|nr:MAG: Alpha/beta hydrolase [Candidatus Lokiarchaeota archaeon]
MPRKLVNGAELYYEIHGDGEPIVMIMGLSANIDWWTPEFLEELERRYKTILFDNRDAGRSDNVEKKYQIEDLAKDTIKLMDQLDIDRAHILGISMGGMVAQEIALNYPERVKKLVLASTNLGNPKSILPSGKVLNMLMKDREGRSNEEIIDEFISLLFANDFIDENPEFIKKTKKRMMKAPIKPDAYQRQLNAILKFKTGRRLKGLNIPTLVIHGKKDILLPPENGEIIADLIPNANLKLFEGAGHSLFSHIPKKTSKTIIEYLENHNN